LDDQRFELYLKDEGLRWIVASYEGSVLCIPVHASLFPLVARRGAYDLVLADFVEGLKQAHGVETEVDGLSFWDETRPLERISLGHFKPMSTPGGKVVEAAVFTLKRTET
jgi:hypothetical protein